MDDHKIFMSIYLSTLEAEAEDLKFKKSLGYEVQEKPATDSWFCLKTDP